MPRRQRDPQREQHWRRHLDRQQASGVTVRVYCRANDLAETAFRYWRQEIARRDRVTAGASAGPAFVRVAVVDPPTPPPQEGGTAIDIRLAGGRRVRVRAGCDRRLLADVLALLEGRPC